jgi:hypothetical protein
MSESRDPQERDEDLGTDEDLELSEDQTDGVVGGLQLRRSAADEEEPPVQT